MASPTVPQAMETSIAPDDAEDNQPDPHRFTWFAHIAIGLQRIQGIFDDAL